MRMQITRECRNQIIATAENWIAAYHEHDYDSKSLLEWAEHALTEIERLVDGD